MAFIDIKSRSESLEYSQKSEVILFLVIFLVGVIIRFINLGLIPFNTAEAMSAYQALQLNQKNVDLPITQPAYLGLTGLLFMLFEPDGFWARLIPVLLGSLFVLLPIAFRQQLGIKMALFLSLVIAIDPLHIASSRMIGSPMIGFFGLMFFLVMICWHRPVLAGIGLSLAISGGEVFWSLMISIGVALLVSYLINKDILKNIQNSELVNSRKNTKFLFKCLVGFFVGLILLASGFFFYPAGLGNSFVGIQTFLEKFSLPSGVKIWQVLVAALVYGFVPLTLGIFQGVLSLIKREKMGSILFWVAVVSLLIIVIQPGRQVLDLVVPITIFWFLAARLLSSRVDDLREISWVKTAVALFSLVILVFLSMNVRSMGNSGFSQPEFVSHLVAFLVGIVLLIIVILLVGFGWQFSYALHGLVIGIFVFFVISTISMSLPGIMGRSGAKFELWQTSPIISNADAIISPVAEISDRAMGEQTEVDIALIGSEQQSLLWALRNFVDLKNYATLPQALQPSVIISSDDLAGEVSASYRGTETSVLAEPAWNSMGYSDVLNWMITRKAPIQAKNLILWIRSDLFKN